MAHGSSTHEMWWKLLALWLDVVFAGLRSQHSLGFVTMSLALSIFFICVLYGDLLVHEILAVHAGDCAVGGFKVCKRDEAVAFGQIRIVPGNLLLVSFMYGNEKKERKKNTPLGETAALQTD